MASSLILQSLAILGPLVTLIAGWLLGGRRKQQVDVKVSEADLLAKSVTASEDTISSMMVLLTALRSELAVVKAELAETKTELAAAKAGMVELREQNRTLIAENTELTAQISQLRAQISDLAERRKNPNQPADMWDGTERRSKDDG